MLDKLGATKPLQPSAPLHGSAPLQRPAPLQSSVATPAMECAKPLQPIADEPSLNRQEPSEGVRARKKRKTTMPKDFELRVSTRVADWAAKKGFGDLDAHLEHFVGKSRANGYVYADWEDAFMNSIRDDWAKLRSTIQSSKRAGGKHAGFADKDYRKGVSDDGSFE
jgi:hypothetical protein